jgi:ABC transporter substrate binding protein
MSTASKHENIIFRKSSENLQVSILDIEYNARIMDAMAK